MTKTHESQKITNAPSDQDDEYSLAGEVAWEYCKLKRSGGDPLKSRYRNRLPDKQSREEFDLLVSFNDFAECAAEYSAVNPKFD